MSFSFANLFAIAKTVITDVAAGASEIAPIAAMIPGAAPVVTAFSSAATVANDAIAAGEGIVAAVTPEITQLEALFESLFHVTVTPGGALLTAKTSVATVSTTPAKTVAATKAAS